MPNRGDRRRPGAASEAGDYVTQREFDAELRGISFKLKCVLAISAINLPLQALQLLGAKTVTPVALIERLFS